MGGEPGGVDEIRMIFDDISGIIIHRKSLHKYHEQESPVFFL